MCTPLPTYHLPPTTYLPHYNYFNFQLPKTWRAVDTLGAASAASSAGVAIVLDEDDTSDSDAFEIPESDEESSVGDGLRNTNLAAAKSFAAASVESSEKSGCCEIAV